MPGPEKSANLVGAEAIARRDGASPVIAGVLDRAFAPDELDRWWFDQQARSGVASTSGEPPALWLHVVARGEWFDFCAWSADAPEEDSEELRDRLVSDLQDWIAESRFGWAQQRLTGDGG